MGYKLSRNILFFLTFSNQTKKFDPVVSKYMYIFKAYTLT